MENCCMRYKFRFWFDDNKSKSALGINLLEMPMTFQQ